MGTPKESTCGSWYRSTKVIENSYQEIGIIKELCISKVHRLVIEVGVVYWVDWNALLIFLVSELNTVDFVFIYFSLIFILFYYWKLRVS